MKLIRLAIDRLLAAVRDNIICRIMFVLSLIALIALVLLLVFREEVCRVCHNILVSFFASIVATIFTVYFVNRIFIESEEKSRQPIKKTALARATLFMNRLLDLLGRAVRAATPPTDPSKPRTLDDLLSRRSVERIFLELDLTKQDMPAYDNWRDQFQGQINELLYIAQELTTVYAGYLPPDVYDLLVELTGREANGLGAFFYHVGIITPFIAQFMEHSPQLVGMPLPVPKRLLEVSSEQAKPTIDRMTNVFDKIKLLFRRLTEECQKVQIEPPHFPAGWLSDESSTPWGTAYLPKREN